jgi:hypothetical protein
MMFTAHKEVIQSDEFQDVEMSEVVEYTSSLIKKGIHSDIVLEAVLQWIKHDSPNRSVHMPELFACVSVDKCTRPFLAKVVEENSELLEPRQNMYKLILNYVLVGDSKELLVIGGQTLNHTPNDDFWIFKDEHLVKFAEGPGEKIKPFHSMCQVPQGVMLTGGKDSDVCKLFDVANMKWMDRANLLSTRSVHGSGCLDGKVFVIGGKVHSVSNISKSVDYMDLEMNTWQRGPDIPESGFMAKAVAFSSRLFVLFSKTGRLYCLDTERMSWTKKATIPTASLGCSMAAVDDRMFAVGGNNYINYMYIPNADTWVRLTGPSLIEKHVALVYHRQKLCLIVGCRRDTDVEEYDINSDI